MPDSKISIGNSTIEFATRIVEAYLLGNQIPISDLPDLIINVHNTIKAELGHKIDDLSKKLNPAVSIETSITDDFIICLEDGKKLKMLKRYLRSNFGLSPEEYRKKWNLPADYPMVAPNYAIKRSDFAKKIGLGRGARN